MSLFNSQAIVVRRKQPGEYVKGVWVAGRELAPFTIFGTVQPATGATLQTLPEGKRLGEIVLIVTQTELTAADPDLQVEGDLVEYNSRRYEITESEPWQNGIIPHYEYLATRVKEGQQ